MQKTRRCFTALILFVVILSFNSSRAWARETIESDASVTVNLNGAATLYPVTATLNSEASETRQVGFDLHEDQSFPSVTGQPAIPFQTIRLLLPAHADPATIASQLKSRYTPIAGNWYVAPTPPAATRDENGREIVIWPQDRTFVDGCDVAIYDTDAFWPAADARLSHTGRMRGWKLAELTIPLFRYNPMTGQLLVLEMADLTVTTTGPKQVSRSSSSRSYNAVIHRNRKKQQRLKEMVVNYDQAAASYDEQTSTTDSAPISLLQTETDNPVAPAPGLSDTGYVIITTNAIRNASSKLDDFVAHKQLDYTVSVITEDQYGTGSGDAAANHIRAWLQANYNNSVYGSGGILYVLLIGDPRTNSSSVPMKMCIGDHPTDYFYAELTSNWDADGDGIYGEEGSDASNGNEYDKYFEVYVGRIPYYGDIQNTDHILQKLIDYENATATDWRRKALLPMVPLDDSTPAYQMGEQIKYNLLEPKAIPSTRIYEENYGTTPPPEFTLSERYPATEWSQGAYGMVIWQTHGWDQGAAGIISTGDTPKLNDSYPSAVFQGSCVTGQPETTTNLGYSILKNGGIGTVAASRNGWYWVGESNFTNSSSVGGLGYQYAKRIAEQKTLGQALWDTKEAMGFWQKNYYVYNLYGDPSVTVMPTAPAFTVTPTHASYFNIVYGGISSEEADYTLKNTHGYSVQWTAETGEATWYDLSAASGTINANGSAQVTITLNAETKNLPAGTYQDTILFTNITDNISQERTVIVQVYPRRKIAYWTLDETAGTTAADVSGNGHDGTVVNTDFGSASVTGQFGAALQFDGTDDHIVVPGFSEDISELTVSAWIKADAWTGNNRIYQKGGDGSEFRLLAERGAFVFEVGSTRLELSTLPATGRWVHVAAVYDGATMKIYYDKVLQGSRSRTGMVPMSGSDLYIGTKNADAGSVDRFKGALDEIRIYNFAQDEAGIRNLYDGIDEVEPLSPSIGAVNVLLVPNLEWSMASGAIGNDIYFGTDYNAVVNATASSPEYKGRQPKSIFAPNTLKRFTEYFWRIDQVDASGTVTRGPVWTFKTGNGCGGLTRQVWYNIGGNYVSDLTNNTDYPDNPDLTEIIDSFEGPTDWAENYGSRLYGFLVPPVTGSYTFWIASDDYSELWLSTDDNPANVVKIAYAYGATSSRQWDKYASQKSAAVPLTAGKPYYIMALHKEGAIGDNIAVAFSGAGLPQEIIPGRYLMPYTDDYDFGPGFTISRFQGLPAAEGFMYQDTMAGTAFAFDGTDVTYSKAAGPLWLQVSPDGTLSGVPGDGNVGQNMFDIRATDARGESSIGSLSITVDNTFTGEMGLTDFAQLAARWLQDGCVDSPACQGTDLTGDGAVGPADLATMGAMWLMENSYGTLAAHWPFDTDADDTANDHDGVFMNGAAVTESDAVSHLGSGSLVLDGVDDYVDIPGFKGVAGTSSRTCMAWIKTASAPAMILSWGTEQNGRKWTMRVESDGTLGVGIWGGVIKTDVLVDDGQWHHVAAVLTDDGDPDVSEILLYVDGQKQRAYANNTQPIDTGIGQNVLIGTFENAGALGAWFSGGIDDVQIYDCALAQAEISRAAGTRLQLYCPFDETSGTVVTDDSFYKRIGQLNDESARQPNAGISGGAVSLDGQDQYVEITDYKGVVGTADRTCTAWIKTSAAPGMILSWGTEQNGQKWTMRVESDGTFGVGVWGGVIKTTVSVNDGQWHHVAAVLTDDGDPDISKILLYVDGQKQQTSANNNQPVDTGIGQNVLIGAFENAGSLGTWFNGSIDEVQIYTAALSQNDIYYLAN